MEDVEKAQGFVRLTKVLTLLLLVAGLLTIAGCGGVNDQGDGQAGASAAGGMGSAAPAVVVTSPIEREVIDAKIFPNARVQATDFVEVRARVSGYLTKMFFQPGAEIQAGTPLFEVDPSTYQAILERAKAQLLAAEAQVQVYEARVGRLKTDLDRGEALLKTNSMSEQEVDTFRGNYAEAVAGLAAANADVAAAKAAVSSAELDLQFTEVTSPINGMVSREQVTLGNLVTQGTTKLTEIVSMDPIHVYFDIDVHTLQMLQEMVMRGELTMTPTPEVVDTAAPANVNAHEMNEQPMSAALVEVGLPGEGTYPTTGRLDFSEPSVNQTMGVLTIRAVLPNPKINGVRRYVPGVFATVRIPIGKPYRAMLIPEEAIGTDQNINYVLVVNDQDTVEFRQVILGNLQEDNTRVVEPYNEQTHMGLKIEERIITSGLLLAKPGVKVVSEFKAMSAMPPATSTPAAATPATAEVPTAPTEAPAFETAPAPAFETAPAKEPAIQGPTPDTALGVPSEESVTGFLRALAGTEESHESKPNLSFETPSSVPVSTTGYVDSESVQ